MLGYPEISLGASFALGGDLTVPAGVSITGVNNTITLGDKAIVGNGGCINAKIAGDGEYATVNLTGNYTIRAGSVVIEDLNGTNPVTSSNLDGDSVTVERGDVVEITGALNSKLTVTEIMQEKVMSIGENIQIRRFARFADNTSVAYVHAGGTHGVLVNLAVEGDIDVTELGKNVAMQIAAMGPKYWDKTQVPQADVDKEMTVQLALMDNDPKMASKPAAVKEKIAAGKLAAFYKENCLLQQEFVRSDLFKGDVAGYIADAAKKLGGKVTFVDAVHFVKGEGIEKKVDDFAAEVAAQVANAGK